MKIYFLNSGCTIENEEFLRFLRLANADETQNIFEADAIIANFCALSANCFRLIPSHMVILEKLKKFNPNVKIYIGGCASEVLNLKRRYPFADGIFSRRNMVESLAKYFGYDPNSDKDMPNSYLNVVRIQDGCSRNCGFCQKAYLKKMSVLHSKPTDKIIADIKYVISQGYSDVMLICDNSTEYGFDINTSLYDLLQEICKIKGLKYLYLSALCIDELVSNPKLVDYIKNNPKIRKVQIEIQSLIPEVRKNMNLTSSKEEVLSILNNFKEKFIITNIMVGYPGETDDEFKSQLELIEKYNMYYVQANSYDNTPGVYAYSLKQIPEYVVKQRIKALLQTVNKVRIRVSSKIISYSKTNKGIDCIFTTEGKLELIGFTATVEVKNMHDFKSGQVVRVKLNKLKPFSEVTLATDPNQSMIFEGEQI